MAPADGLLDDLLRVRQGVHIAHFRVEMQLHTLHRGGILPFLVLDDVDVVGIELNVLAVPGRLHLALNAQPHTGIDLPVQPLGFLFRQVFMDGHGAGVVRHLHMEPPHTGPPGLHTFHGEHLAAYRGIAHFQIQRLHFHGLDLDGIAHQDRSRGTAPGRCRRCGCRLPLGGRLFLLQRDPESHHVQSVAVTDGAVQLVQIRRLQRVLHDHRQLHREGVLMDAGAGDHRPQQF